jgi:hypothetical protein
VNGLEIYDGSSTSGLQVQLDQGNSLVVVVRSDVAAITQFTKTINVNTWYKLRMVVSGNTVAVYVDEVLLGVGANVSTLGNLSIFALYSYQSEGWFRNIKVWNLGEPA